MKKYILIALPFIHISLVSALTLVVDTPSVITPGEESLISVRVNTEGETINAIEGSIIVQGLEQQITGIYTGGSAFTLWPNKPSLSNGKITFVGGSTSGITGENVLLFTLAVRPESPSSSSIRNELMNAYIADGQGTQVQASELSYNLDSLNVQPSSVHTYGELMSTDTTPPHSFSIELGRDPSLFDGRYFISFETTDDQSGVNRYEVQEGSRGWIRSGTPYVLQDQTRSEKIIVRAIDNAGNTQIATLTPTSKTKTIIVITILLLILSVILYRSKKRA
jgi:hypothetical protein